MVCRGKGKELPYPPLFSTCLPPGSSLNPGHLVFMEASSHWHDWSNHWPLLTELISAVYHPWRSGDGTESSSPLNAWLVPLANSPALWCSPKVTSLAYLGYSHHLRISKGLRSSVSGLYFLLWITVSQHGFSFFLYFFLFWFLILIDPSHCLLLISAHPLRATLDANITMKHSLSQLTFVSYSPLRLLPIALFWVGWYGWVCVLALFLVLS